VVLEYLRGVRQLVAAERDVMMRYLDSAVPATTSFDGLDLNGAISATAQPVAAAAVPAPATEETAAGLVDGSGGPPAMLTGADLLKAVQAIVSERTGYPVEMLDPDLDLEADLSIDSIKRIEIVGELAERIGLAGLDEAAVDEEMVEELAQHKSLRAIVEWIESMATGEPSPATASASADAHHAHEPAHDHEPLPPVAQRYEVHVEALGPAVPRGDLSGASAVIVAGHPGLTAALRAALEARDAIVATVEAGPMGPERQDRLAGADVLVDLSTTTGNDARSVFADLQAALLGTTRRALAVTTPILGDGTPTGVPGLMRSVARERHDALVRAVELEASDLDGDLGPVSEALVDELLDLDAPAALSWAGGQRTTRVVGEAADLAVPGEIGLGPEAVVVITGGARGITARVAEGLARANPCRLVLVGRSALPTTDEDPRTAVAEDRHALRRALLEIGELKSPHDIEAACNRIEAAREMRASIEVLESFGATVDYRSLDVRSPEFGALLDEVCAEHGRLDGVIHGAGVLDDHFLRDKTAEGFDRVYGTKVDGARAILDRIDGGLRFVVLFGSVSGVFGNRGQCDYSAANDALDTLARTHDGREGCRVVSIDWGPWGGGGMVSPELEREYARRGIGLVDPDDGVLALLHEVAEAVAGRPGPAQLVVMRGAPEAFAPPVDHTAASDDLVGGTTTLD
jgi:NAD(P)-dependent dehydrogenase (short-subunit alcohol dehydrogenase family)/acyl carrier protein